MIMGWYQGNNWNVEKRFPVEKNIKNSYTPILTNKISLLNTAYNDMGGFLTIFENTKGIDYWYGTASSSFHKNLELLKENILKIKNSTVLVDECLQAKETLNTTVRIYIDSCDDYNDRIDEANSMQRTNSVEVNNYTVLPPMNPNYANELSWATVSHNKSVMNEMWREYNTKINSVRRNAINYETQRNDYDKYIINLSLVKDKEDYLTKLITQLEQLDVVLNSSDFEDYMVTMKGHNARTPRCTKTLYISRASSIISSDIRNTISFIKKLISKIQTHKDNIIKFERGETVEIIVQNTNETVAPKQEVKTHVVQSGESLASIAAKYNLSWEEIYKANKDVIGNNPSMIFSGMKLVLPGLVQTSLQSDTSSEIIQNELLVDQTIGGLQNLRSYKEVMATNWGIEADGVLKGEYGNPMQVNEKGVMVNKSGQNNIRISSAMSKSYSNGEYTSKVRTSRTTHNGVDLSGSNVYGTNIQSLGSGIVLEVVTDKSNKAYASASYGNYVKILHEQKDVDGNVNYVVSLYAHMTKNSSSHLKVGSIVNEGDVIGQLGTSGNSTGPHLHLELADTDLTAQEMSGLTAEEILAKVKNEGLGVNKGDYYDMGGYFESKGMVM